MAVNLRHVLRVYRQKPPRINANSCLTLCFLCDTRIRSTDHGLCSDCRDRLPLNQTACPVCAGPMPATMRCPDCLNSRARPIDLTFALCRYEYPINRLIQAMKFQSRPVFANLFGHLLVLAACSDKRELPDCLCPVPLHRRRLAERGYNQSLEIARPVAARFRIPIMSAARVRHTRPQTELSPTKRRSNVADAFRFAGSLAGQHVVIVDDVVTSGATVASLARILRDSGARRIEVWACARGGFS